MATETTDDTTEVSVDTVLAEVDSDKDGKVEIGEAVTYFLHSRTIIVNTVAIIAMVVQSKYGFVIDQALQTEILLGINMWLRTNTTKPIAWKK